ncbi:MAG: hypothetical protein KF812_03770 [Fimbriimonadaceae bacterium]|nr:hypothetical protein [Fimbriimonadaceae bacterium]
MSDAIHESVPKMERLTKMMVAFGVLAVLFGGYTFMSESKQAADLQSRLTEESKKLAQAQQDAENVDPNGNFHRITGDRVVQVFSHRLQEEAQAAGIRVEKASQDKNIDPLLPAGNAPQAPSGWGMVQYEFELSGQTRSVLGVVRKMAESGLAFEIESLGLMRKPGTTGNGEVLGRFTVRLVTRGGAVTPPGATTS